MIIAYIKRRTAKAILAMADDKIKELQDIANSPKMGGNAFLRCQFKINVLEELKTSIKLRYQLFKP